MMPIGFDLETWPTDRGRLAPTIVCGSFLWPGGRAFVVTGPALRLAIEDMLISEAPIAGAFIAFDMACICANWPELTPLVFAAYQAYRVHDVLLREKQIDIAEGRENPRGYGLQGVAANYGIEVSKETTWRLEYPMLAGVPVEDWPREAREYCEQDALVPVQVFAKQEDKASFLAESAPEAFASFALRLASCWGVHTNAGRVEALVSQTVEELNALEARLQKTGLVRADGSRDTKLAKAKMAASVADPKRTKKGEICLDEDACLMSGDATLIDYAAYASVSRVETLLDDLMAGSAALPLQTRFNSCVDTYRTSSMKPSPPIRGMQMQNFAKDGGTRECFEPRPGYVFAVADVASMELHFWAQFCHDMGFGDGLLEDLNNGTDCHIALASLAFNIQTEAVSSAQRDWAKGGNYGFPGGMGASRFALVQRKNTKADYPVERAEALRTGWFQLRPQARLFFDYIGGLCERGRTVYVDGEAVKVGTLQHPSTGCYRTAPFCSLANFTFQHPSAIGVKRGLCALQRLAYVERTSAFFGSRIWNMVHDELCAEVPEDRGHEAAQVLSEQLTWGVNTLLPDCPTRAPVVLCRTWSKAHKKPKFVNGRMVPL